MQNNGVFGETWGGIVTRAQNTRDYGTRGMESARSVCDAALCAASKRAAAPCDDLNGRHVVFHLRYVRGW